MLKKAFLLLAIFAGLTPPCWAESAAQKSTEWISYGRDPGGMRFSPDTAINRQNVSSLQVAWTFRTGELQHYEGTSVSQKAAFEATPLMVADTIYLSTPTNRVFALEVLPGN